MRVIVIVGLARSGKDTSADYIVKKYGFVKYTFSSVLFDILIQRGEKPKKEKMILLGDKLRAQKGMDALAQMLDKKIKEKNNIVLVGPRSIEEIEYFRKKFSNIKIIKITAKSKQRFTRKSKMDPQHKEEFFERDEKDLEKKGMQKVLDSTEVEIKNYTTRNALYMQIDELMEKWQ